MTPGVPMLSCRELRLQVSGRTLCAALDIDVHAGQCWAIVGPNGAGKTTLLRTLAGLRAPDGGTVAWNGRDVGTLTVRERARVRAWLAETSADFFASTALETVLVGRHPHVRHWQWESSADIAAAMTALDRFGMAALADRDVTTLSGGERRRVALAAMVTQDAPLLLLDEPASHLDLAQQIAAFDALAAEARDHGRALVMVVHDLHLALRYADHVVALGHGRAQPGSAAEILTADRLGELFGRRFVAVGTGRARTFVPE